MRALAAQPFRSGTTSPRLSAPRRLQLSTYCKAAAAQISLTDVEKQALSSYRANARDLGKDEALQVLKRAVTTKSVPPELLEGALLTVEELSAQENKGPTPSVVGRWRLVFGTGTKLRPFQYIPVKEDFILDEAAKRVALESSVGPFSFIINGVFAAWKPESGELDFQFTRVDILFNGDKVWEVTPKTKPKTYTFFHVGSDLACARSSAGGVALLAK